MKRPETGLGFTHLQRTGASQRQVICKKSSSLPVWWLKDSKKCINCVSYLEDPWKEEGMKCLSEDELCFPFLKTIFDIVIIGVTVKGSSAPSVDSYLIARNDKNN